MADRVDPRLDQPHRARGFFMTLAAHFHRPCQFGRASAPIVPHFVQTMRGPNEGTVRSPGRWSLTATSIRCLPGVVWRVPRNESLLVWHKDHRKIPLTQVTLPGGSICAPGSEASNKKELL